MDGSHSCYSANTPYCLLPRKPSPDGVTTAAIWLQLLSFINPERTKGWVGLVSWPTADGLPISESSPVRDRRSTTEPHRYDDEEKDDTDDNDDKERQEPRIWWTGCSCRGSTQTRRCTWASVGIDTRRRRLDVETAPQSTTCSSSAFPTSSQTLSCTAGHKTLPSLLTVYDLPA